METLCEDFVELSSEVSPEAVDSVTSSTTDKPETMASNRLRVIIDPNGQQYSSNSFDRFGDDLSELLLSYLVCEDKFRFECISKQWQRLVYNKVYHLDVNIQRPNKTNHKNNHNYRDSSPKRVTDHQMKTLFLKCHNVRAISLYVNEQSVSSLVLLSEDIPSLKSITLIVREEVSPEAITAFGETFGSKVEEIIGKPSRDLLYWCPNLKRLNYHYTIDWSSLVGNQLVPKLNSLRRVEVNSDRMPAFIQLVDKYKNTMKRIKINSDNTLNIDLVFQQIYRLNNLEYTEISYAYIGEVFDMTPKIIEIGKNCRNLSKVKLNIGIFKWTTNSEPLNGIKSLNITCILMSDNFFANLSHVMPNLKELIITSDYDFTNQHMIDLSKMKHLKRLYLTSYSSLILLNDSGVIQLLDNCKQIRDLKLEFKFNITLITIDKLKEVANNRHKDRISFSVFESSVTESQDFHNCLVEIPGNLSINIMKEIQ